jgi:LytS/YehU family sensor histidine kinase
VLAGVPFPPLMLLTLVENAIRHGLAPQPGGGAVRVDASLHDRELRVRVSDSGRGFTQTSGRGTGLANVRARLAAIYGESGRLSLKRNLPQGVVATIALPLAVPLR